MGKKAKGHPTRSEQLAALKRELNLPVGKVKNPSTPAQQKAALKKISEGVAAMDEEIADLQRAVILERVRTGTILPSWAEKLLKPASEPNAKPEPACPEAKPKQDRKPLPRRRPGKQPTKNWPTFVAGKVRDLKRAHKPIPTAASFCQLCENELDYQPDVRQMQRLLRGLRA
ncbi:hypothetical protein M2189_003552 [Bradyrhizobium japonicum]|uniref:hypothetical protein n=1 Tax=Bradyrhizobium japonicum TaxID=375 RepID=UPI00216A6C25|nr:hypothetical protein [Bradyrhizobium japonicum]MCS3497489.1 hypothetical protein [Bradyrhizobium japonicum]MCS3960349.1 hypothetical protein [Bradyrhizobium japonicum]MCS4002103.1 hypothetical protein [Bradyrhizobium japonicum]